jgi:4a-hydroxytetrahydrobiopterin dehydratase
MLANLLKKTCKPCEGGTKPMPKDQIAEYMVDVPGWVLDREGKKISKEFKFVDFIGAINFVERVADVAEMDNHHPDIHIHYNKVTLDLWTHAIGGLSENDFILAAKINEVN